MRWIALSIALEAVSGLALAQSTTDSKPPQAAPGTDNWTVGETTSPVDYRPIITATASSQGDSNGHPMQLSVRCRAGRTELVVSGPAFSGNGKDHAISYRVDDSQPVQLAGAQPTSGTGIAFASDVVRFLQSLPERGELAIRVVNRSGSVQEGHFSLGGLKVARERLATVCQWPHIVAGPRN